MSYGYIYLTYNKLNGKIYIGQKKGEYNENYLGSGRYLKHAIAKYGKENFENYIIQWCDSKDELNEKERYWIAKYNSKMASGYGYNISEGGDWGDVVSGMTNEQREIYSKHLSIACKGEKNGMHGKKHSKETLLKISNSTKQAMSKDEVKEKFKQGCKNRKFKKVCKNCNQQFETISTSIKWCSNECRKKIEEKRQIEKDNMRYASIKYNDVANGPGIRVSFWTQGCPHRCKGCHNEHTWSFDGGQKYTRYTKTDILSSINAGGIDRGFSVLGGEPLCNQNLNVTFDIVRAVKKRYPEISIWLWTGYEYESIKDNCKVIKILQYIDVLVDGKFVQSKKDLSLKFRGSSNQRILDVQKSLNERKAIVLEGI